MTLGASVSLVTLAASTVPCTALTNLNRIAAAAFGLAKIYGELKHEKSKL